MVIPPATHLAHRYIFTLYALDTKLELEPQQIDKARVLEAMQGHILGAAKLTGTFERK